MSVGIGPADYQVSSSPPFTSGHALRISRQRNLPMPRFRLILTALVVACAATLGTVRPVAAQPAATQVLITQPQQARETRDELRRLMEGYPPSLGRLFKLDPALMTNAAYMAPYPGITAFIQRHPEVPKNTDYFLNFINEGGAYYEEPRDAQTQLRSEALRQFRDNFLSLMVFSGFVIAVLTMAWLVRYVVSHRRWLRSFKAHTELHTKLLERFHSSDELMAYLRTGPGAGFMQLSSLTPEPAGTPGGPFNKILWSIQAGVVLICGGSGLLIIKQYVVEEAGDMLLTFGVLAASLGAGFVLAAAASYLLSRSLGLLESTRSSRASGV
jgi:hypothetical protein